MTVMGLLGDGEAYSGGAFESDEELGPFRGGTTRRKAGPSHLEGRFTDAVESLA